MADILAFRTSTPTIYVVQGLWSGKKDRPWQTVIRPCPFPRHRRFFKTKEEAERDAARLHRDHGWRVSGDSDVGSDESSPMPSDDDGPAAA